MKTRIVNNWVIPIVFAVFSWAGLANSQEPGVESSDQQNMEKHKMHHQKMMKNMKQHKGMRMREHLKKIDTNQDGKVDLSEYLSNAEQRFNEMDSNGDQYVTADEARQMHQHMRKKHRQMSKKHGDARHADDDTDSPDSE